MATEQNFDPKSTTRLNNVTHLPFMHRDDTLYQRLPHDLTLLEDLSDYQVARGEIDPRGWEARDRMGEKVGRIRYLVASPSMQRVYFVVIDGGVALRDKLVVVPLGKVMLELNQQTAALPYLKEDLRNAPPFERHLRDFARFAAWWNTHRKA